MKTNDNEHLSLVKNNIALRIRKFPDRKLYSIVYEVDNTGYVIGAIKHPELWDKAISKIFDCEENS